MRKNFSIKSDYVIKTVPSRDTGGINSLLFLKVGTVLDCVERTLFSG